MDNDTKMDNGLVSTPAMESFALSYFRIDIIFHNLYLLYFIVEYLVEYSITTEVRYDEIPCCISSLEG